MIINGTNNHQMMSKDNIKIEQISSFSHLDLIEIPQTNNLNERVYFPNWDNAPPPEESVVKWGATHLLARGGLFVICAKAGIGKSSVTEAFLSSHLNQTSDSLGVKINLPISRNKILICDTERSEWESHKAWSKLMKRASINEGFDIEKMLVFANLQSLDVEEKFNFLNDYLLQNTDIGLVLLDGSADFLNNTNDITESNKLYHKLKNINKEVAFVCTIHTNPTDNKPRGHWGTLLCAKAESVLLLRKINDMYELTTDFDEGKLRHSKHISWYYKWCDEKNMFASTDEKPQPKTTKKNSEYSQMAIDIFGENERLKFKEIVEQIGKIKGKSEASSKQIFYDNFQLKICERIEINGEKFWKLIG